MNEGENTINVFTSSHSKTNKAITSKNADSSGNVSKKYFEPNVPQIAIEKIKSKRESQMLLLDGTFHGTSEQDLREVTESED